MRQIVLAVLVASFSSVSFADSVFIVAEPQQRIEIGRVLRDKLPELQFAERRADADFVLELRRGLRAPSASMMPATVQLPTAAWSASRATNGPYVSVPNPEAPKATATIGSVVGVVHTKSGDVVLMSGIPSPFFAEQVAREFVRVYAKR